MHTSLSKKLLAGLLSLVMVLSLVAPSTSAQAATKYSLTDKKSVKSGVTFKYELKGVSKGCYVKVTRNVSGEKVVYNKKELTKTTKINGTGKTLNLYVTYGEKDENYTGKFTVKVYGKKTNKLYKTLVETVTVKVPEKEEPQPDEPVVEEAALVSLEATGAKKLTATLSKEATVTAADLVVKKGNITVTPADVTVDGTKVVITLGSKIVEGTYSVTYKEKTVEVATKDETLTELKTVGTDFAQLSWDVEVGAQQTTVGTPVTRGALGYVAAQIEYQALNQYGEPMNAEINNVVSSFGGEVRCTEPTVKKNGVIQVWNIAATLGILGNSGRIIIVSKNGVSTSNDVTFAEESKLAKLELAGIYNNATSAFVDAIPATKAIANYKLLFKAYDQYGYQLTGNTGLAKINGQSISQAQVLTNVKVADVDGTGKLSGVDEVTVNDVDYVQFDLASSDTDSTAKAGTLQIIVVGDRFGTALNETVSVSQINLIKSFTMTAPERIYNADDNEISFEALDENGNKVTSYKELKKLVSFKSDATGEFHFEKNTDGSAKLIYTPAVNEATTYTSTLSNKQSTVRALTVTCNADYSAADQLVTTKTFTVYQKKIPMSIVKYKGTLGTEDGSNDIFLYKSKFVFEDQYGNTLTKNDNCYDSIKVAYYYGTATTGYQTCSPASITATGSAMFATFDDYNSNSYAYGEKLTYHKGWKFYAVLSTGDYFVYSGASPAHTKAADNLNDEFDLSKADVCYSFKELDSEYATNLTAVWHDASWMGTTQYVGYNDQTSGLTADNFYVTGYVNGEEVEIPAERITIKSDDYSPIGYNDRLTAVKEGKVVLTVLLRDDEGEEFTEEVEASYQYSSAPSAFAGVISMADYTSASSRTLKYGALSNKALCGEFFVYDQYGFDYEMSKTLEISLGKDTDLLTVKSNNSKNAYVYADGLAALYNGVGYATVVCTLANGQVASEAIKINYGMTGRDASLVADAQKIANAYCAVTPGSTLTVANNEIAGTTYTVTGLPATSGYINGSTQIKDLSVSGTSIATISVTKAGIAGSPVTLKIKFEYVSNGTTCSSIKATLVRAEDDLKAAVATSVVDFTFGTNPAYDDGKCKTQFEKAVKDKIASDISATTNGYTVTVSGPAESQINVVTGGKNKCTVTITSADGYSITEEIIVTNM